jgi:hypothetical protein
VILWSSAWAAPIPRPGTDTACPENERRGRTDVACPENERHGRTDTACSENERHGRTDIACSENERHGGTWCADSSGRNATSPLSHQKIDSTLTLSPVLRLPSSC